MSVRLIEGDCRKVMKTLPAESVHCVVTSPPYWGLRDYGVHGQIGLEDTMSEFLVAIVAVFGEIRRVLRSDGTCWVNLGDSYATGTRRARTPTNRGKHGYWENPAVNLRISGVADGLKPKDLCGIPWRVAFALQADGWWLRQDIIWSKPNPMPESVTDRCTKAHEYLFLLSKSERYHYDAEAIEEAAGEDPGPGIGGLAIGAGDHSALGHAQGDRNDSHGVRRPRPSRPKGSFGGKTAGAEQPAFRAVTTTRNKRSVWTVPSQPFTEAHFATFPPALIEPCILAGCPEGGTVLDPFAGAGTTGLVADRLKRNAILIELNPDYAAMARRRISADAPLLAEVS